MRARKTGAAKERETAAPRWCPHRPPGTGTANLPNSAAARNTAACWDGDGEADWGGGPPFTRGSARLRQAAAMVLRHNAEQLRRAHALISDLQRDNQRLQERVAELESSVPLAATKIPGACVKCGTPSSKLPEGKHCCAVRTFRNGEWKHSPDNTGKTGAQSNNVVNGITKELDYDPETGAYTWTRRVRCGEKMW